MYEHVGTVTEDPTARILGMAFMAPVAGYVLITPGHQTTKGAGQILRAISTIIVSAAILAVTTCSDWHSAHSAVRVQFSAFSGRKVEGSLAIQIGLTSATIRLQGSVPELPLTSVDFSEKFTWSHVDDMKRHYQNALHRGLPFPVLTAAEYLSLDSEGFRWGKHYRQAGYYATFSLWCAFALWLLTNILWPVDVLYSTGCLVGTGFLLLITNAVYSINLPKRALVIPYEGHRLEFSYGWCYHVTLTVGILLLMFGVCIYIIHHLRTFQHLHDNGNDKYPIAVSDQFEKSWRRQVNKYHQLTFEK